MMVIMVLVIVANEDDLEEEENDDCDRDDNKNGYCEDTSYKNTPRKGPEKKKDRMT